jgi:hypothetical protein
VTHWALTLYERYVQLYGEPIEQPMRPRPDEPHDQQLAPNTPLPMKQDPTD